jgi:hypothetical protein
LQRESTNFEFHNATIASAEYLSTKARYLLTDGIQPFGTRLGANREVLSAQLSPGKKNTSLLKILIVA